MSRRGAAAGLAVVALLASACSSSPPAQQNSTTPDFARELAGKVTLDAMMGHLRRLADIASANNGNRADGTPGYDASVGYVAQSLRDKGFDVATPEFHRLALAHQGSQTLAVAGRTFPIDQASLLLQTPPGGLSAPAVRATKAAGCGAGDYGVAVTGAIAVVDDSGCSVVDKQNAARGNGAVALLVVNTQGDKGSPPGLFPRGYYDGLTMPVGVINADADAALRRSRAPVRLTLDSKTIKVTSRNLLAQTKTGDTHNVVMAGANLDSARDGPGVNGNGSGVAALLEAAIQLGSAPSTTNAVRFAFWGAGEAGQAGSTEYVSGLGRDDLNDIALYLNFDALASPNAGYFTYDGDQSGQPNPEFPAAQVPVGSAGVERTLAGYLNLAGRRPADLPLGRATGYGAFLTAGIPIGGMTTGITGRKTDVQARLWGGSAGAPFDPNYRTARDTIDSINRDALATTGPGVAFAVGTYARSIDGANGVPPRDQRHRQAARS